jgi:hypothetical protein
MPPFLNLDLVHSYQMVDHYVVRGLSLTIISLVGLRNLLLGIDQQYKDQRNRGR